ncbi:MAG: hypothetical protein E6I82_01235 [Chloroflexi bacterium]|nr:MAG: hypothetical protein E6I82_01235 [Chloroflexota bacterium]TMF18911.1 MAG: hypothetical protein E6I35_04785 [Chloroflexota bacterium]
MSQNPSAAVGQVSADGQFRWDGQQWVPIPRGAREPTPWTRPMQLASAGFFAAQVLLSIFTAALYINHDSMLKVIQAQGNLPQGTDPETVVSFAIFIGWATVVVVSILGLVAALGSYLGWRWMFWVVLVLCGLNGIGAITNLSYFVKPEASPMPTWAIAVDEVFAIAGVALFVWLLIGVIRFGPWAMKKPGT